VSSTESNYNTINKSVLQFVVLDFEGIIMFYHSNVKIITLLCVINAIYNTIHTLNWLNFVNSALFYASSLYNIFVALNFVICFINSEYVRYLIEYAHGVSLHCYTWLICALFCVTL